MTLTNADLISLAPRDLRQDSGNAMLNLAGDYTVVPTWVFAQLEPLPPASANFDLTQSFRAEILLGGFTRYLVVHISPNRDDPSDPLILLGRDFLKDFVVSLGLPAVVDPQFGLVELWFSMGYHPQLGP